MLGTHFRAVVAQWSYDKVSLFRKEGRAGIVSTWCRCKLQSLDAFWVHVTWAVMFVVRVQGFVRSVLQVISEGFILMHEATQPFSVDLSSSCKFCFVFL